MKNFIRFIAIVLATMILMPWLVFAEGETEGGETTDGDSSSSETAEIEHEEADVDYEGEDGQVFNTCFLNVDSPAQVYTVDDDAEYEPNEEAALTSRLISDYETAYSNAINADNCGTTNSFSGSLEKGDCAAAGKVVSEITEAFASDTKLGNEAEVLTVYKSSCCMIVKEHIKYREVKQEGSDETTTEQYTTYECEDVRSLYFTDNSWCDTDLDIVCEKRQWIIGSSGASIIKIYIKQIYIWAASTIGFISVIIIVINGIRISVSGASGDITQAKERILQSISGLVLLFLSGLLLYTINPTFFS